jgi:hypothetical protein
VPSEGPKQTKSGVAASEKARGKSNLGIRVNNKTARCSRVESRDFWDIVVLPFTLLFLKLERNAANRASLDALHQVGGKPRYLVAQAF